MPRPSRWDDVVAAAAKVFRERGYDGASVEDVADEVGMLKGSIYNYISTKEDLLLAVVRPPAERLLREMRDLEAADGPAGDKIRLMARSHARVIEDFLPYVAVYVQELAGRQTSDEWMAMDREYVTLAERIVEAGMEADEFRSDVRPRIVALSLIGSLNWLTRWYQPDGPESALEVADQIADLCLRGLSVRPATTG
ncbi:MAG TPA: TetR/AcrR family transcriptional regulator [Iamia sp.]|nr:TetR/AcrR family transcriptional regulator [Iamia sp.]